MLHSGLPVAVLLTAPAEEEMTPNQITLLRVLMGFAAVALFARNFWCDIAALALTIAAITLDALDGYLARRRKLATALGAQFDILGDRVVENLFFTFFAVTGLVSLWVPVLFFVRGTLTDFLRSLAARAGQNGFDANSLRQTWWGRALVASRASRAAYGAMKCLCFCYLGVELTLVRLPATSLPPVEVAWVHAVAEALISATVAFCLIRAVPVFWEGRRYFSVASSVHAKTIVDRAQ
ncbi:MAG TPA: CDP-alcohol phosphatidyltransferase family protein [Candidatus Acidoferrales bacterium]|nr:CDP-alcohol phosphatidyltransferase family protein [Candidatus Acidoferrales bacterium]